MGDQETRIAIYLTQDTYDDLRAAYLWQFDRPRGADSMTGFIRHCVELHMDRDVQTRMRKGAALPPQASGVRRFTRSYVIGAELRQEIRDVTADERPARWLSSGAWTLEAVRVHVEYIRRRAGGTFAAPPARTPSHLPPKRTKRS